MAHNRSDTFGRLVKGAVNAIANFEGKNAAIIEEELSDLIKMAPTAIHRFKGGYIPNNPTIVEILAEAGVSRAYLNRAWLQRFLQAARYYDAATLLERLYPRESDRPTQPRIYDNLPAPTYSQFVMRAAPYAAVLEGLGQRSAVVVVVSLGGMGKTSLAREIAAKCLRNHQQHAAEAVPHFDAAVWISGKDRPDLMNLAVALDEIAHTLGYPGITQFEMGRKQREVEQVLKRRRVLLVVDNFETVTDVVLLQWLLRLPEPSKALVTTREYRSEFQQGAWLIELGGMSEPEAEQLITERMRQLNLKLTPGDDARQQLIVATGGNPKAIEMLLGLVKSTGQPLAQVVANLLTSSADLLADLFATSWQLLHQDAHYVLLTMTLFPASVDTLVLAHVAGVEEQSFFQAIQQLVELALLDTEQSMTGWQTEQHVRRILHPLTRRFLETRQIEYTAFLDAARERCLAWAVSYAARFGYITDDITRLEQIDCEEANLFAALTWAFDHEHDAATVQIARGLEFYYYVRALWGKKLALHQMYIAAAHRLGDTNEEIHALTMHVQLLSRQGDVQTAASYLPRLHDLAQQSLQGELFFHVQHALGLYQLASGHLDEAQHCWEEILEHAEQLLLPDHMTLGAQHWLAACLYQQGQPSAARQHYQVALEQARRSGYERMVARNQLHLALIDLEEDNLTSAHQRLLESRDQTVSSDWEQLARIQQALARLHNRAGNLPAAREALLDAIDLFERMGLTTETQAARSEFSALVEAE